MKYLIVGGWTTGTAAAQELRRLAPASEIVLVDSDPARYYARPGLIDYLAGRKSADDLSMHDVEWYRHNRLELISGRTVNHLRPADHTIILDDGRTLEYDRLLLATGARPFIPPLPGADQPHVFSLRTLADANTILGETTASSTAVVIGGGVLGLEAARALCERGMHATVLETAEHLLPRQLDVTAAEMLRKRLASMGIATILKAETQEIVPFQVKGVEVALKDGRSVRGQFILFSTGVRSSMALAQEAAIATGRGIQVDDTMRTSLPDIYAAGDAAEHRGQVYGIIPPCLEQARVAARNMISPGSATYSGSIPSNSLKIVGIDVFSVGISTSTGSVDTEEICAGDDAAYRKVVLEHGKAKGAILFGTTTGQRQLQEAIRTGRDLSAFRTALTHLDWDFSGL